MLIFFNRFLILSKAIHRMQLRMHDAAIELKGRKDSQKSIAECHFWMCNECIAKHIIMKVSSIDVAKKLPIRFRSRAFAIFRRRSLQISHLDSKQRERGSLLDVLSRIVTARRKSDSFVYCKIQSTMTPEKDEACDLSDVILQENSDVETQVYAVH